MKPKPAALVEISINAAVWITWIIVMNSGTENGIGFFHQPGHNLLWPLLNGALFNAFLFLGNAFWLIPRFLAKRRIGAYLAYLAGVAGGVLALKTLAERALILMAYPDLHEVPLHMLALENLWVLLAMIVLSSMYRFGRDWLVAPAEEPTSTPSEIWIKSGTSRERVALNDILHIDACDNYVVFELRGRSLMALMSMQKALDLLPESGFIRIHRSHIIALDKVERMETDAVVVAGTSLPIGRTYRTQVKNRLSQLAPPG